jgi:endoglucanase
MRRHLNHIQQTGMPRWRGFNLLQKFRFDNAAKSVVFARPNMPFDEEDFALIRELGFDFVRLPLDYLCWSDQEDWRRLDERTLAEIDQAVDLGRQYGLHVCLNFHRAPGYCINAPAEPRNLFKDAEALDAFRYHWTAFAQRYKGISGDRLTFNLINEPPDTHRPEQMTRQDFVRVMRAGIEAIRAVDPARPIIVDGLGTGKRPVAELIGYPQVYQSTRGYAPLSITHHDSWLNCPEGWVKPEWPGKDQQGLWWDAELLRREYECWADIAETGVGVFCGEVGCFNKTPHDVVLAWFNDQLQILTQHRIGYALWNFKGPFGILNSGRADVAYERFHGHLLDRQLLALLQRY